MELATAVTTAKQPNQQTLSGSNRGHGLIPLPVYGISPRYPLVLFIGAPVYVAFMMIGDENPAVFSPTIGGLALLRGLLLLNLCAAG